MAIGVVLCLSLMLSGYAVALPSDWLTRIEVSQGACAPNFTNGCCNGSATECLIRGPPLCYCDRGCHEREDCCDDIEDIGCHAPLTQCADARLDPGNCQYKFFPPPIVLCRAFPHRCYCDRACKYSYHCDCCDDVPNGCYLSNSTSNIQNRLITRYLKFKGAEAMKSRLQHYLQRRLDRLSIAQSEDADDAEMLERRLLHYLAASQSNRRRPYGLPVTKEVEFLERALAEHAREYTSKKNN